MRKLTLLFLFTSIVGGTLWSDQQPILLDMIASIPAADSKITFKNIPIISVDNLGVIYALDNRFSEFHVFNPFKGIERTIARKGQGPGELNSPIIIFVDDNRIYIRDSAGISIYSKEGIFNNRFHVFFRTIDMAVNDNKIYVATTGSSNLITVYELNGNKIDSFGSKYSIDYDLYKHKEWSPQLTDWVINKGKLLFSPSHIYYVSTTFADVFKYDKEGHSVSRQKLVYNERIKDIEKRYFREGLKDEKKGGYGYFYDIAYFDGSFYGLTMRNIYREIAGDIVRFNERDFSIEEIFLFSEGEVMKNWTFQNLCVRRWDEGGPQFYVSYYDDDLAECKIGIFKNREGKK